MQANVFSHYVKSNINITADEMQTWRRNFRKRFIENAKKSPELKNIDPKILWDILDKSLIFKELKFPYQKVKSI